MQKIFFLKVFAVEDLADLHDAGSRMAFCYLGGEVASFETDETVEGGGRFF